MGNLYSELKRRNIFRVAVAYLIVAWLVVQVINDFAVPMGMPPWTPIFFIMVIGACFPIALLLSWAYEITPQGMKRSHDVSEEKSITPKTGRTIDRIIIAGVLLTVIYYWLGHKDYFQPVQPEPEQPASEQIETDQPDTGDVEE
ncbi:MAG: hypothetical protein KAR62_02990 [Sphingomonadales bacterium]|nr:hypothetical protein [Sphingomonadales bacterium]